MFKKNPDKFSFFALMLLSCDSNFSHASLAFLKLFPAPCEIFFTDLGIAIAFCGADLLYSS